MITNSGVEMTRETSMFPLPCSRRNENKDRPTEGNGGRGKHTHTHTHTHPTHTNLYIREKERLIEHIVVDGNIYFLSYTAKLFQFLVFGLICCRTASPLITSETYTSGAQYWDH